MLENQSSRVVELERVALLKFEGWTPGAVKFLGRGGFGAVYQAVDVAGESGVFAIKVGLKTAPEDVVAFRTAAKDARLLPFRGLPVLPPLLLTDDPQQAAYVMRLMPGAKVWSDSDSLSLELHDRLVLAHKVANVVHAIHCLGLVVGDIHPGNFLFSTDFSDVVMIDADGISPARLDDVSDGAGYPAIADYAAPERHFGKSPSMGTDRFHLAAVVHEFSALYPAFRYPAFRTIRGKASAAADCAWNRGTYTPRLEKVFERAFAEAPFQACPNEMQVRGRASAAEISTAALLDSLEVQRCKDGHRSFTAGTCKTCVTGSEDTSVEDGFVSILHVVGDALGSQPIARIPIGEMETRAIPAQALGLIGARPWAYGPHQSSPDVISLTRNGATLEVAPNDDGLGQCGHASVEWGALRIEAGKQTAISFAPEGIALDRRATRKFVLSFELERDQK